MRGRPAQPFPPCPEPMRILYLHHVGGYSGAAKSLVEMLLALPPGAVDGTAIVPAGAAARALEAAGLRTIVTRGVAQWDDTRFSHYRGWRWLVLLRELAYWPATLRAIREAARSGPYDLIHCNEVTALLPALAAKRRLRAPLVVHVRSLLRGADGGRVSAWLTNKLRRGADSVVAIDEAVRRTLPADLPVSVIHNGLPAPAVPPARPAGEPFRVGIVGVLHPVKGVYEFVAAARLLRERGVVVRLLVVGDNVRQLTDLRGWLLRRLNIARDVRADLEAYVAEHGLADCVEFTGFVADIRTVYSRLDAVCFPSHYDAPGRPVFEAALYGLPAIVAMRNPTDDVVVPGVTGLCIDTPDPQAIADAIALLAGDRARGRTMGGRARELALQRFEIGHTARSMLALYRRHCPAAATGPTT